MVGSVHFGRTEEGGFPVLTVFGRIGTGDVALFEGEIVDLCQTAEDSAVLDLTDCEYLNSRALPLILNWSKQLRVKGHDLFVCVNEEIQELLGVLRLANRLSLLGSREEALKAARAQRGLHDR